MQWGEQKEEGGGNEWRGIEFENAGGHEVCGKASSDENGDEGGEGRVSEIPELSVQSILNATLSHPLFGNFH